jgi:hypothetical protein
VQAVLALPKVLTVVVDMVHQLEVHLVVQAPRLKKSTKPQLRSLLLDLQNSINLVPTKL